MAAPYAEIAKIVKMKRLWCCDVLSMPLNQMQTMSQMQTPFVKSAQKTTM